MELQYDITKEDYIAFNLNYFNNNAIVQRSMLTTRIATAAICLLGGTGLMYWLKLSPWSVVVYVALAAACFFGVPPYMRHKMVKNVDKILKNANNKQLCGSKTLMLEEETFRLVGENEDTTYQYEAVQRIATDETHYYVFVDEFSAVIVPFSAFKNDEQRMEFYDRITAFIKDEALKC